MLGKRYTVSRGDNLWNLAKTHLGGGAQWPRIWRYNNRPDVIAITGKGIENPDLIFINQVLIIPVLPVSHQGKVKDDLKPQGLVAAAPQGQSGQPQSSSPQPLRPTGPLEWQLPDLKSPVSFKIKLDDIHFPSIDVVTAIVDFRMTGDVVLRSSKSYPATYVTSRGEAEVQFTQEMNHAFGKLIADNRFIYDPGKQTVTVRSMMVSQSNTPNAPSTAVGVEMSSNSPMPKLRAEIRFPKLEGSIANVQYVAVDVKFVIEITPRMPPPSVRFPSPQPVRVQQPGTNWPKVIGTGLIITGTVIVVATIVEDFFTAGAGVVDDPASFAAAAAAFARGLALLRGTAVALPAVVPATIRFGVSVH